MGGINAILTNMSEDSVGEVLKDICATKSLEAKVSWTWSWGVVVRSWLWVVGRRLKLLYQSKVE